MARTDSPAASSVGDDGFFEKPGLYIWPTRAVAGWDGVDDDAELDWHERAPLVRALMQRYPGDAHAPMYEVPGEEHAPRINKSALARMIDDDLEPALRVAMIDLDNDEHEAWADGGSPSSVPGDTPIECLAFLRRMYPEAGVYSTRGGLRLVFVLSRPVPLSHGDALMRWLVSTVPGADHLVDWTRCFRLPYVHRDGVPSDPIVDFDALLMGRVLDVPDIETLDRAVPARALATLQHDPRDAPEPPSEDIWQRIGPNSIAGQHLEALRHGGQLAEAGERNRTLFQIVRSLAHQIGRTDTALRQLARSNDQFQTWLAHTIYACIYRAVIADDTAGAPTIEEAWGMIRRTASKEAGKWVQRMPALASFTAPDVDEPPDDIEDDEWTPDPENPILVKIESAYFVRHHETGAWSFPVDGSTVPTILRDYQPRVVLGRGPWTTLPGGTLVKLYGIIGTRIVYDMGIDATRWDSTTRTMRLASCQMAEIRPQRHPEIEEWLLALGGESESYLLDWLATAHELRSPTSALYIEGPKDVGKGMLAFALARMYSAIPIPFIRAIEKFNISMVDCPIVWIDESVEASRRVSGAFRSLITEPHRQVEQKYLPSCQLEGCVRLIICANNGDAIKLSGRHTRDDVEAIRQRVFHLQTDDTAANYIRRLGGRAYTEGEAHWVEQRDGTPGMICEHIRWLQLNREVRRGKRLLVEGPPSDYHRRLLASSSTASQVLWAIAEGLLSNIGKAANKATSATPGLVVRPVEKGSDGTPLVWVNVSTLHQRWKTLITEDVPRPERADVLAAVRSMSMFKRSKKLRVPTPGGTLLVQCWAIDPALVLQVADDFGLANVEALVEHLDDSAARPRPRSVLPMPSSSKR